MSRSRALLLSLVAFGCTPPAPAKHPDHDGVVKAQAAWCAMLAELDGEKAGTWRHAADCRDAYPGASSAFLERLTPCYRDTMRELGDQAPDSGAIIDKCSHEVLGGAAPGNVDTTELYRARCARQERCQKVTAEICAGTWERLDGMTRALLTSKYNLRTQSDIAACLDDKPCEEDEAAAEAACYRGAHDRVVWLPISLGHDASLGPKVD